MSEVEKKEAELRLLDVLLAEEFGGEVAREDRGDASAGQVLDLPVTVASSGRSVWPVAAALLLGTVVVTGAMLAERVPSGRRMLLQDPQGPTLVKAKTVKEFLSYLDQATCIQLVAKETVGAGRVQDDANGSSDRLDTIRWPQTLRIEGKKLAGWRKALQDSSPNSERSDTVDNVYDFELVLPGDRLLRTFATLGGAATRIWIADDHPMVPNKELLVLFEAADRLVKEKRRLAFGKVHDRQQLLALPAASQRLDVAAEDLVGNGEPECFASVQRLKLNGEPSAAALQVVAGMPKLRSLELVGATLTDQVIKAVVGLTRLQSLALRQCMDFSGDDLRALGALRKLHTLHLIDTSPDGEELQLDGLASLPVLREFGLRAPHMLGSGQVETIGRTKIERLLLVDLDMQGDLGLLARLPSLHDVVLVAKVGDQYLQPLSQIESLQLLTIRNATADGSFVEAITSEVPGCEIDWTENARWWGTDYAFRYIERAWSVPR